MDPAPSRGVDVGIAADGEDLLEEQEQALIRCVKTAGLRKPRELALVDQLLEVRRIRRRATAVLVQQRDGWAAQATTLQGLLTTAQETLAAQETQRDERLHEEISRMEKNYRAKLEEYVFRRDASVKTFVSGLKEKYTKQISILESKLKEISEEYDNKTRASVVEKQQRRIVELEAGLADQTDHIRRYPMPRRLCVPVSVILLVDRYKETILAISERERDLESALSREGARCARLANEKGCVVCNRAVLLC